MPTNKVKHIELSQQKQPITLSESDKINMSDFPILLKDVIDDFTSKLRSKRNNPYLSGYKELETLTGRSASTLHSYTNEFNPVYPPVDVLYAICKATGDFRPMNFLNDLGRQ
jgi:hypothetical protein